MSKNTKQVLISDLALKLANIAVESKIASTYVHNNSACWDLECKKKVMICLGRIYENVLEGQHLLRVHQATPAQSGQRRKLEKQEQPDHRPIAQAVSGNLRLVSK